MAAHAQFTPDFLLSAVVCCCFHYFLLRKKNVVEKKNKAESTPSVCHSPPPPGPSPAALCARRVDEGAMEVANASPLRALSLTHTHTNTPFFVPFSDGSLLFFEL
eukprot:TRINITY_DN87_c1_g1_i1.p4 TRINITY_DN87_c1_g1~~TRINITY_DN87_c1_g1_i1.p4  ORF type:complete len:105 (+),score=0.73 TRINITY_DN87_c1_g1_i1:915-1229(+)